MRSKKQPEMRLNIINESYVANKAARVIQMYWAHYVARKGGTINPAPRPPVSPQRGSRVSPKRDSRVSPKHSSSPQRSGRVEHKRGTRN